MKDKRFVVMVVNVMIGCGLIAIMLSTTGCPNWQGGGIRIGWENYNQAEETKAFKKEVERK